MKFGRIGIIKRKFLAQLERVVICYKQTFRLLSVNVIIVFGK